MKTDARWEAGTGAHVGVKLKASDTVERRRMSWGQLPIWFAIGNVKTTFFGCARTITRGVVLKRKRQFGGLAAANAS